MPLSKNKKGIEFSTLLEIVLLLTAGVLIIYMFSTVFGKADDKTSENLCRGFNAIRYATQFGEGKLSVTLAPNACRTIDKKEFPSKNYKNKAETPKDSAQREIRDHMARCWWMWLEGNQKNMFTKSWYNWENGCFICYTFSTTKEVGYMSYEDLSISLNKPYYAVDRTDRCAPLGQGGTCMDTCKDPFTKEVPSTKCNPQESLAVEVGQRLTNTEPEPNPNTQEKTATGVSKRKCCVSEDGCVNRGGKCLTTPDPKLVPYTGAGWECKQGRCYLEPDRMASYLDYIQGTRGAGGGAGKVIFLNEGGINPGAKYAITFVSPGDSLWTWDFVVRGSKAAGGVVAGKAIVAAGGLFAAVPVAGWIVGTGTMIVGAGLVIYSAYQVTSAGDPTEYNYIFISKYDTVKNQCEVQAGAGEK